MTSLLSRHEIEKVSSDASDRVGELKSYAYELFGGYSCLKLTPIPAEVDPDSGKATPGQFEVEDFCKFYMRKGDQIIDPDEIVTISNPILEDYFKPVSTRRTP